MRKETKMMSSKQAKEELNKVVNLEKKKFNPPSVKRPAYYEVIEYQQGASRNRWYR